MAKARTAAVVRGRIIPPDLPANMNLERAFRTAIVPATRIERYTRTWRMGQVSWGRRVVEGRIGYRSDDTVEVWDEEAQDFRVSSIPLGQTSPFALHLGTGRVAFQRRTTISAGAFSGAITTLLDAGSQLVGWSIEMDEEPETFDEFVQSVDAVERLSITVVPPNPNFKNRTTVKHVVGDTGAKLARLNIEGDAVDVTDAVVAEFIEHAADGYGETRAVGRRQGRRIPWNSRRKRATEEITVPADQQTGEASGSALREQVASDGD